MSEDPPDPADARLLQMRLRPGPLAGAALSRLLGLAAGRAGLPSDRVADTLALARDLAERAPSHLAAGAEQLDVSVLVRPQELTVALRPLTAAGAQSLAAANGWHGPPGSRRLTSSAQDDGATLTITLTGGDAAGA